MKFCLIIEKLLLFLICLKIAVYNQDYISIPLVMSLTVGAFCAVFSERLTGGCEEKLASAQSLPNTMTIAMK